MDATAEARIREDERERCAQYAERLAAGYLAQIGQSHADAADGMRCVAQSIRDHWHKNWRHWEGADNG